MTPILLSLIFTLDVARYNRFFFILWIKLLYESPSNIFRFNITMLNNSTPNAPNQDPRVKKNEVNLFPSKIHRLFNHGVDEQRTYRVTVHLHFCASNYSIPFSIQSSSLFNWLPLLQYPHFIRHLKRLVSQPICHFSYSNSRQRNAKLGAQEMLQSRASGLSCHTWCLHCRHSCCTFFSLNPLYCLFS